MATMFCKTCGGATVRQGDYDVCEFCGNRWEREDKALSSAVALDLSRAWAALRCGTFEVAAELFEYVLESAPGNHEAHWGRALATNGILYVTDYDDKKIPTCNNITEYSFTESRDVKLAIENAPADIAKGYQEQAAYIEAVRAEWLEKANKEAPYDVFISFKDSDRENGLERTQDSYDAHELYIALSEMGYRVFFSRVSLRNKVSEHYEPYIYNAIKTAKVMIVFGEKPEYFNAVWVKNEWKRFQNRIKQGEKHPYSLVTVYKDISPADLPIALQTRQCLRYDDLLFFHTLTNHISRVMKEGAPGTADATLDAHKAAAEKAAAEKAAAEKAAAEKAAAEKAAAEKAAAEKAAAEKAAAEKAAAEKAAAEKAAAEKAAAEKAAAEKAAAEKAAAEKAAAEKAAAEKAAAEKGPTSQGLRYEANGFNTCRVIGIGACTDAHVIIPAVSPEGAHVTEIGGEAFKDCQSMVNVTIPDSVKRIEYKAFENCLNLTAITIPQGVRCINFSTFKGCQNLASVTVPDSVTCINFAAFSGCHNLTDITLPDGITQIEAYAFSGCKLNYNKYDNAYYLGNATNPFCYLIKATGTAITSCTIRNETKLIGAEAFENTSLTSITIPGSVNYIGAGAFRYCKNLKTVVFENTKAWSVPKNFAFFNIPEKHLLKAEKAAKYLRDTYASLPWRSK